MIMCDMLLLLPTIHIHIHSHIHDYFLVYFYPYFVDSIN